MGHASEILTIFGASGFIGRYVVREAARRGYRLRLIVRDVEAAAGLKTQGEVGQIALIPGDIRRPESYAAALEGAHGVINLVGVLYEKGAQNFASLHAQAPEKLAQHAARAGVSRLVHISALGVDRASTSKYAKTKRMGERAVLAAFPDATILRPSVIFGAEDNFYNQFACMSRFLPFLPLIGGGVTKFQPVYVGDVARAAVSALRQTESKGQTYELGGPEVLSFREILDSVRAMTRRDVGLLPIPLALAGIGGWLAQWMPHPLLTSDQVELLKYDNVTTQGALGLRDLGITPTAVASVVPEYLERFAAPRALA